MAGKGVLVCCMMSLRKWSIVEWATVFIIHSLHCRFCRSHLQLAGKTETRAVLLSTLKWSLAEGCYSGKFSSSHHRNSTETRTHRQSNGQHQQQRNLREEGMHMVVLSWKLSRFFNKESDRLCLNKEEPCRRMLDIVYFSDTESACFKPERHLCLAKSCRSKTD